VKIILHQTVLLLSIMNSSDQEEIIDQEGDDDIIKLLPLWVRAGAFILMPTATGGIISLANLNLLPSKNSLLQNIETVKNILTT
jgi:hypothetical protein